MHASISVEQVNELPAGIDEIVMDSVRENFRFLERLCREWEAGTNRFSEPGEVFLVARAERELAGVCGLNRDPYSTDSAMGRLRHLYVSPRFRREGVARSLVSRAMSVARDHYISVRVRTDNPDAARFYEALGFIPAVSSSDATHELAVPVGVRRPTSR